MTGATLLGGGSRAWPGLMTSDIPTSTKMVLRSGESKYYQNYSHEYYQDSTSRDINNLIEVF